MNFQILIIIAAALVAFVTVTVIAVNRKVKSATDLAILKKIGTGITYAQAIAKAISPFLPSIANGTISTVLNIGQEAITKSEAAYKAAISTDPNAADTREEEAIDFVKSGLALKGIQDTPEIDKLIQAIIPLLVMVLPKTHTEAVK